MPGQVAAHGAILAWTDAVFPVVVGYEIAAGVAHAGDAQLLDQVKHVLAEAVFVGGGMAGLVDAAVDAAAQDVLRMSRTDAGERRLPEWRRR